MTTAVRQTLSLADHPVARPWSARYLGWKRSRTVRSVLRRGPPIVAPSSIRPVFFLGSYDMSSFKLGGLYLVDALRSLGLQAHSGEGIPTESIRDSIVVLVKEPIPQDLAALKGRGNRIIVDMRDNFIRPGGALSPDFPGRDAADVLIFPNQALLDAFSEIRAPRATCVVLYGFADPAVTRFFDARGYGCRSTLKCCYFGFDRNLDRKAFSVCGRHAPVTAVPIHEAAFEQHLPQLRDCSLHLDLRKRSLHNLYKPLTKLLIAAECRCHIVTRRFPRILELLPADYPFLVDGEDPTEAMECVTGLFGTPRWEETLDIMRQVRERNSFRNHVEAFVRLLAMVS
jgi:hypothetical protein